MSKVKSTPLIQWAGSKRKLLPKLLDSMPNEYERYIEPFCGSASLFFELQPQNAILGDINSELINALRQIKRNTQLHGKLIDIPVSDEEYYKYRALDPENLTKEEQAIRFLYLNRYCFNGIYRTNSSGKFNVPVGKRTGGFPGAEVFKEARRKLKNTKLVVTDYKKLLDEASCGDFVYFDPPYSKSEKFTGEYGVGSFNVGDLPEFMLQLDELNAKGSYFCFPIGLVFDTAEVLSKKYNVERINVKRHIAGFKTEWNEVEEILVRNYE